MSRRRPAPLFSGPSVPYPGRSRRRSGSTESDDELYVDRSLPASPSDSVGPEANAPGPSRAYRFAIEEEELLQHARGAFDDEPEAKEEVKEEDDEPREADDDELREIRDEDGDYANVAGRGGVPVYEVPDDTEDEEEPPDERQCRICFSGQEEEATMGRLISPCLCAGSMRYVHVECINAWRGTGTNAKAFMECPQCKHRYKLRRTLISGLASSRPILLLLSTLLFLAISVLAGHILHRFLLTSPTSSRQKAILRTPKRSYTSSIFDIFQEDWDTFDNGVIIVGGGGTLIWDVVMGSIQTFTDVANKLLVRQDGFFEELGAPEWIGVIAFWAGIRFLLGLAVLGSLSFLSLLLSLSLFAPLNLVNGLRGTGLFARRGRNGNNNGGTAAGQLMIILFVLIGAANTLVKVYNLTERITQKLLMYVETQILEVNPAERRGRNRRRKWYIIWWKEGRWARRDGWEEVRVRLWMGAREGLGPVWERMWAGRGAVQGMGIAG